MTEKKPTAKDLKAFIITADDPEETQIIFDKSSIGAKRHWANHQGWGDEIGGITSRRQPHLDQYAPGPVPPLVLIEDGWWFECFGCGQTINDGTILDQGLKPVEDGLEGVYCTVECQAKDKKEKTTMKRWEVRLKRLYKAKLLKKFPELTVDKEHVCICKESPNGVGIVRINQIVLDFKFPGCKYGGSYRIDSDYSGKQGGRLRKQPIITIANGDLAVWEEYYETT